MPSWKNIPSFKAGLGSGSQKTHPHFILCFIFFLHEPFLKYANSMWADSHTSQIHIKRLYLCWREKKWAKEQAKEEYCKAQPMSTKLSHPQSRGQQFKLGTVPGPCWSPSPCWGAAGTVLRGPDQNHAKKSPVELSHTIIQAHVHQLGHRLGPGRYAINVFPG